MKLLVLPTFLSIMMILGLTACGKKANETTETLPKVELDKSQAAIIEETHKELYEAILTNNIDRVRQLLENKSQVDLNKILENGETLMTTAVARDLYPIVELLLNNNASLIKTNSKKETPLIVAAKLGLENLARLLISFGSKPDAKDLDGNTALHLAIINNYQDLALFLINSRTNIDITNNDNQTALRLAEILNMKKVLDLLRSLTQTSVGLPAKIDVRNLITLGDVENLNQLFIKFPAIAQEYEDLNFYVLIINSHNHDKALSMMNLLLSFGADLEGAPGADVTPLIEAVKHKYEDFVVIMLKENVNPNILDEKGNSPLIWAIKANHRPMVKMLLDKNALDKYTYYLNGRKKTMKACDVAKEMKRLSITSEDKKSNEDILDLLGCGLRRLF
jgi:ankyrin repeat protein